MHSPNFGLMGPSLLRTNVLSELNSVQFLELQVHDNLKHKLDAIPALDVSTTFGGHVTLHGEGETDGKHRISFCSNDESTRKNYITECVNLYSNILTRTDKHDVKRIILHPDTLVSKIGRLKQLELLAKSLSELGDRIGNRVVICIEPRGGDRQGKVLRNHIQDIEILQQMLGMLGEKRVGFCIDIAQLFIVHGNTGIVNFLKKLETIQLPIKEFHLSDVFRSKYVKNRVAMEIGTGSIDWRLLLPFILGHCNELLIETLGGTKVFQRSKEFLISVI